MRLDPAAQSLEPSPVVATVLVMGGSQDPSTWRPALILADLVSLVNPLSCNVKRKRDSW